MPFTKFSNLDFDQIKTSIKDYLRANSNFTDFDFEGSNFSVLIDTLAYNTYITAFNSNMVVNESFLDSATVRENVVSLARNIGYVPKSRTASSAVVSFTAQPTTSTSTLTLQSGLVCTGSAGGTSYVFSVPENITASVINGTATFSNITLKEGTFLRKQFTVNGSLDQRFILDNSFIDTTTIRVYVKSPSNTGLGNLYTLVDNIFEIGSTSETYLIQEVKDEKYEILFGDGRFGKKLENNSIITVTYIITDGKDGNGANAFSFAGTFKNENDVTEIINNTITVTTIQSSQNGSDIESIQSVKSYAPRLYASQYRAVTSRDYESLIKSKIYENAESISVVGGEELSPPQFGKVLISIKPKNGTYVSDFDKQEIKNKLKQYTVAGINPEIIDLKVLYVEIDSSVYYNYSQVGSVEDLKTKVISSLNSYAQSPNLNAFGGRFKYSKVLQVIDNTDAAITSNITKVRLRRDLKALIDAPTQYEICFGNKFHINPEGKNIKSTGFKIFGEPETVYLTDTPNKDSKGNLDGSGKGTISIVKETPVVTGIGTTTTFSTLVIVKSAGTVDYSSGEILLNGVTITETSLGQDIIEIQAFPESNDIIGLKDLYLSFSISKSKINMIKDVIASGDDVSGTMFSTNSYYRSSYSNGELKRS
jgi:hypothetical protein